jgi:hypothetical protein
VGGSGGGRCIAWNEGAPGAASFSVPRASRPRAPSARPPARPPARTTLERALAAAPPDAAAWAERMQQQRRMFVVPKGSNDDWYFLYAAVVARVGLSLVGVEGRISAADNGGVCTGRGRPALDMPRSSPGDCPLEHTCARHARRAPPRPSPG